MGGRLDELLSQMSHKDGAFAKDAEVSSWHWLSEEDTELWRVPHWKKSPARMSWMPPKGCSLPRRSRAICSSALNSSAEIMEISSRISTCQVPLQAVMP